MIIKVCIFTPTHHAQYGSQRNTLDYLDKSLDTKDGFILDFNNTDKALKLIASENLSVHSSIIQADKRIAIERLVITY